ncbi:MAG: helix-turn-helix domain-containing protein [Planctomycetota bacterium]|jgi:transcriptional regulator with XRE-family HTH domain
MACKKRRKKKQRKRKPYTRLGERIAALASRQWELADVLGVTQQSISHKLHGVHVITVPDLEKLARHYKVHITYFFEDWRP